MDSTLLDILRCPETGQKLTPALANVLSALNERIDQGNIQNQAGITITEPVTKALIREDGKKVYPVRENIPLLLSDESITL